MDKIGGLMNKLGGSSSNTTAGQPAAGQTTTTGTAGATGQQDYGDKGTLLHASPLTVKHELTIRRSRISRAEDWTQYGSLN